MNNKTYKWNVTVRKPDGRFSSGFKVLSSYSRRLSVRAARVHAHKVAAKTGWEVVAKPIG